MYGTQTAELCSTRGTRFENDVKMYGTQTLPARSCPDLAFENDVKCMVLKRALMFNCTTVCLRMM